MLSILVLLLSVLSLARADCSSFLCTGTQPVPNCVGFGQGQCIHSYTIAVPSPGVYLPMQCSWTGTGCITGSACAPACAPSQTSSCSSLSKAQCEGFWGPSGAAHSLCGAIGNCRYNTTSAACQQTGNGLFCASSGSPTPCTGTAGPSGCTVKTTQASCVSTYSTNGQGSKLQCAWDPAYSVCYGNRVCV